MTSANAGFFMYLLWCNEDRADNDDILWLIKNERSYEASEWLKNLVRDGFNSLVANSAIGIKQKTIERRWKELFEGELYKTKEAFESLKLTWSYIEDRKKIAGGEFDKEWFDLRVRCCLSECIKNIWLQAVEAGVLDDGIEKTGIPTSLEDAIAIIRRGCSLNCTNAIVELLDARIALQLEELDFEIREEGNKTNLYKMKDEYKIDFELLAEDANQNE